MNLNRVSEAKDFIYAQGGLSPTGSKSLRALIDKKRQNLHPFDVSGTDFSTNSPSKPSLHRSDVSPISLNSFDIELCNELAKEKHIENDTRIKIQCLEKTIEENQGFYKNDRRSNKNSNHLLKPNLQIVTKIPSLSNQATLELDEENFLLREEVE